MIILNDDFKDFIKAFNNAGVQYIIVGGYNSVNLKMGYPTLEIRTPMEVIDYGDENKRK
ncbi:hypothetical protein ACFLU5_14765 [Bacteroidota bacterium]